ncbi:Transcriptional regulator [gamma proteobacterium HdN1]|nr:Transcriptional regulator [gamma proteobacterium HdN1]
MASRIEQREKTRTAIVQAALHLSSEKGFPALSLREVTREAGVAPATFYRYFIDMEALGLAIVDEVGLSLRQLMRKARHRVRVEGSIVNTSIETFMDFIDKNPLLFQLLMGDRAGGPRSFRAAIKKEKQRFVDELADDLSKDPPTRHQPLDHITVVAEMMVNLVFDGGIEALSLPKEERAPLAEKLKLELRIILTGSQVITATTSRGAAMARKLADATQK